MVKAKKGSVVIRSVKGKLRLVWTHDRTRYFLATGLDDTKRHQAAAMHLASTIERDMQLDVFDATLAKYKANGERLTVLALFDRFCQVKFESLQKQTQDKYKTLASALTEYFGNETQAEITLKESAGFLQWLSKRLKPITVRDRYSILNSCWEWGIKQKLVTENPWRESSSEIRKAPRIKPNPFTKEEVEAILGLFRSDPKLQYYADFVEFKLRTGTRTGEAVGLCWKHLSKDCASIEISEAVTKGERKPTKTGESRQFRLSPQLRLLLSKRKPVDARPHDLVFPAVKGGVINANNFARYYWKPALVKLGIAYRKPYKTRSTFDSHALEAGMTPAEVADITGKSQQTLFKHYAGTINKSQLPDLW